MRIDVMFSSQNEVWATPQGFFDKLNEEFGFNLDPCALPENAKCEKYFTPEVDGLKQDWGGVQSVLQPSIWEEAGRLGAEMLHGKQKAWYTGGNVDTSQDRYSVLSRLHLS